MSWAKYAADFLTGLRPVLAAAIAVVGFVEGKSGLGTAILLLLVAWTTDWLDGPLARLSSGERRTWVGDHDLVFDIVVGVAVGLYLGVSGLAPLWLALTWIVVWMTIMLLHDTLPKPFGAIFQGPIYIWFGVVSLLELPSLGVWLWVWAVITNVISYKRLFKESLPEFFQVLRQNLYLRTREESASRRESEER
jgi:cardiolipin synthase